MGFRIVRCELVEVPVDQDGTCRELDEQVQQRDPFSDPLVAQLIRRIDGSRVEPGPARLPSAEAAPPLFSPQFDFDTPRRVVWNPDEEEG